MARQHREHKAPPPGYGIKLTMGMVVLSWVGLQCFFIGTAFGFRKVYDGAMLMVASAVVLVGYSLYLRARLKKADAVPTREQAQLFYLSFMVFLIPATVALRWWVFHKMFILGVVGWGPSALISVAYLLLMVVVLRSDVDTYPRAPRDAWSRRIMRVVKAPLEWFKEKET